MRPPWLRPVVAAFAVALIPLASASAARPLKTRQGPSVDPKAAETSSDIAHGLADLATATRAAKASRTAAALSPTQTRALSRLERAMPQARLSVDARRGSIRDLALPSTGRLPGARVGADGSFPEAARAFLSAQARLLGLEQPSEELTLTRDRRDRRGGHHLRFSQSYRGVPLFGHELRLHYDAAGALRLVQGDYRPTPVGIDVTPRIDAATAQESAWRDAGASSSRDAPSPTLVLYAADGDAPRLSWIVDVERSLGERWRYFVDARDGAVIHRLTRVQSEIASASGTDLGGTLRQFNVWHGSSSYFLLDPSTPTPDASYDPLAGLNPTGDSIIYDANYTDGSGGYYYVESPSAQSGWDATAVSATHHMLYVYEYYLTRHGRESIDNAAMNLVSVVHYQQNYANAFWNGTMMVYGDGDNSTFGPLAGCLDIAAHEMTHGVTETSTGLIYENQSGALNESFSDVFAAFVEHAATPATGNWLIGEGCTLASPGFLRSMIDPHQGLVRQPKVMSEYLNLPNTYDGDYGGVHTNSGIPNRAAYLLTAGLSAEGLGTSIGFADAEELYYTTLTDYLSAYAQFVDARRAMIAAAEAIWGTRSLQVAAVQAAWDAVEVYDGGDTQPLPSQVPTSADPAPGNDLMVYLYPTDGSYDPNAPTTNNDGSGGAETYDVYAQTIPQPFTGYNAGLDVGPLNSGVRAAYTRPASYTTASGTYVVYVGADNNLYGVLADGSGHTQLTSSGTIYSVAASPDGRTLAYTTIYDNDNHIYVLDAATGASTSLALVPTGYDSAADPPTIEYADALGFDYTGRRVVFDGLNCLSVPQSSCDTLNGGYRYVSIGFLEVASGDVTLPFPNQNPAVSIGYPAFASNNDYVVVFDKIDGTTTPETAAIVTFNQLTHTVGAVLDPAGIYGIPSFSGDDQYAIGLSNTTGSARAYRVPLDSSWVGDARSAEVLNSYDVALPIVHRAGVRTLVATLQPSATRLDFAEVPLGDSMTTRIVLTNAGNRDIRVTDIRVDDSAFSHNGTNGLVPRGESMTLSITFSPGSNAKQRSAHLFVTSDADSPLLSIALVGDGPAKPDPGGCAATPAAPFVVLLLLLGRSRRRRRPRSA